MDARGEVEARSRSGTGTSNHGLRYIRNYSWVVWGLSMFAHVAVAATESGRVWVKEIEKERGYSSVDMHVTAGETVLAPTCSDTTTGAAASEVRQACLTHPHRLKKLKTLDKIATDAH